MKAYYSENDKLRKVSLFEPDVSESQCIPSGPNFFNSIVHDDKLLQLDYTALINAREGRKVVGEEHFSMVDAETGEEERSIRVFHDNRSTQHAEPSYADGSVMIDGAFDDD